MPKAEVIAIRHARTDYTQEGLDITLEGIEDTKVLARSLIEQIKAFDNLIVISSPLPRAKGTAQVFLEELQINCPTRVNSTIRCIDITDIEALKLLGKDKSGVYGETWFKHPYLEATNEITESRSKVNLRAYTFLRHISQFALQKYKETNQSLCILVFTHFEIATNYLRPLYPDIEIPTIGAPGLRNSEAITIVIDDNQANILTIKARNLESKAKILSTGFSSYEES